MTDYPNLDKIANTVLAAMVTAGATITPAVPIGDGQAPPGATSPFAVLYWLDDIDRDGPINSVAADAEHNFQITSVGHTREQAQWVSTLMRSQLTNTTLDFTPDGRTTMGRIELDVAGGVERDDDVKTPEGPVFYSIDTFRFWTTPS